MVYLETCRSKTVWFFENFNFPPSQLENIVMRIQTTTRTTKFQILMLILFVNWTRFQHQLLADMMIPVGTWRRSDSALTSVHVRKRHMPAGMRTYYMIVCLLKLRMAEQMSAHAPNRLRAHESKQYCRKWPLWKEPSECKLWLHQTGHLRKLDLGLGLMKQTNI